MARTWTKRIIVAVTLGLIAWDVYVYFGGDHGTGDTISAVVLGWAMLGPALPFALGALVAHLVWPKRKRGLPPDMQFGPAYLGLIFIVLLGLQWQAQAFDWEVAKAIMHWHVGHPAGALIAGIVSGRLLWPQYSIKRIY